jgi:hypothetical protein
MKSPISGMSSKHRSGSGVSGISLDRTRASGRPFAEDFALEHSNLGSSSSRSSLSARANAAASAIKEPYTRNQMSPSCAYQG